MNSLVFVLVLTLPQGAPPASGAPMDVVRSSTERITALLRGGLTAAERAEVLALVEQTTSFPTIAKEAVGPRWDGLPRATQDEFVRVFSQLVGLSSIEKMGRLRADRTEYLDERIDASGDRAVVRTRAFFKEKGIALDYTLRRIGGEWKIVSYALDGVDTVAGYRKQFGRVLGRDEPFSNLMTRLTKRLADLQGKGAVK